MRVNVKAFTNHVHSSSITDSWLLHCIMRCNVSIRGTNCFCTYWGAVNLADVSVCKRIQPATCELSGNSNTIVGADRRTASKDMQHVLVAHDVLTRIGTTAQNFSVYPVLAQWRNSVGKAAGCNFSWKGNLRTASSAKQTAWTGHHTA